MRGTLLNTATVATGSVVGIIVGKYVPTSYQDVALSGLGLVTCLLGVRMFFSSKNVVALVAAVALGGILGTLLGIAPGFAAFAEFAKRTFGGGGHFTEAIVTTSVLFCVGPMTLLGCLQDGLENKIDLLAVKSTLDGISAFFFAAMLGSGVLVTAGIVLLVQGSITMAARRLQKVAKQEDLIAEMTATGGALMLGTGLGLLGIKKLSVETYLPTLALAPLFVAVTRKFDKKVIE